MTDRVGDWVQTYRGKKFWPLDPRAEEIDIIDIAHALSMTCRFGGHSNIFYSVAEHSCHVHDILPPEHKRAGLLHDGSESYISDIVSPAKKFMPEYRSIEDRIQRVISEKYGLTYPYDPAIKDADVAVLVAEQEQIMGKPPEPWLHMPPAADIKCQGWQPNRAKMEFLYRFSRLYGEGSV